MSNMDRRQMMRMGTAAIGALAVGRLLPPNSVAAQSAVQKPPPLDPDLVKKFVSAAHTKLDETKAMLELEPHLINATWDWGGGDFETALGGAAHMGRPDIAAFLLEKGARMDVFCATMMGKMDVVKACLADTPAIINVKGPHGISLLRHAVMGKQDAVAAVLKAAGAV